MKLLSQVGYILRDFLAIERQEDVVYFKASLRRRRIGSDPGDKQSLIFSQVQLLDQGLAWLFCMHAQAAVTVHSDQHLSAYRAGFTALERATRACTARDAEGLCSATVALA